MVAEYGVISTTARNQCLSGDSRHHATISSAPVGGGISSGRGSQRTGTGRLPPDLSARPRNRTANDCVGRRRGIDRRVGRRGQFESEAAAKLGDRRAGWSRGPRTPTTRTDWTPGECANDQHRGEPPRALPRSCAINAVMTATEAKLSVVRAPGARHRYGKRRCGIVCPADGAAEGSVRARAGAQCGSCTRPSRAVFVEPDGDRSCWGDAPASPGRRTHRAGARRRDLRRTGALRARRT
jgi:hypothetical protein